MTKIGFLGLGAMGSRMAAALLKQGHEVTVFNRSQNAASALVTQGATPAKTPYEAAIDADLIISMLRDDEASAAVWLDEKTGALNGAKSQAILIESSTTSPAWIKTLSQKAQEKAIAFLDAPVVGSRPQAEAGQLIFLVGGKKTVFDKAEPVFLSMGAAAHYVGEVGKGATMKLAVNTLFGIQVAAWAETLSWLEKSGIRPEDSVAILNQLPTTSPALQGIGKLMAANNDAPLFPVSLVVKDFAYATAFAMQQQASTPLADTVAALFQKTFNAGLGDKNIVAIKHIY